tara:strand:+ start:1313 stop:1564 length:252 start_codon:yes stop_codon:yes gene_type:complete
MIEIQKKEKVVKEIVKTVRYTPEEFIQSELYQRPYGFAYYGEGSKIIYAQTHSLKKFLDYNKEKIELYYDYLNQQEEKDDKTS